LPSRDRKGVPMALQAAHGDEDAAGTAGRCPPVVPRVFNGADRALPVFMPCPAYLKHRSLAVAARQGVPHPV
ncbi:MAG TPA: hypothetical protein VN893_00915, partial [Bryobacteraceae bacterium]|nr:hypothetical protein [Bryobacteraceae bacterium]